MLFISIKSTSSVVADVVIVGKDSSLSLGGVIGLALGSLGLVVLILTLLTCLMSRRLAVLLRGRSDADDMSPRRGAWELPVHGADRLSPGMMLPQESPPHTPISMQSLESSISIASQRDDEQFSSNIGLNQPSSDTAESASVYFLQPD
eukprot:TRINITY_DN9784_c0_g1_i2.p2 TRINITY_DN9784_c0_g1~~TRINITY_DN9784_c0_g1_i2.p2  ORF type:complete len:148 (-),score=28.03 TRINITY_DN9784_c0_g1_i2:351-794(-)